MKKFFILLLVIINIFILFGLAGLVFYQFKQVLDRDSQINQLNEQILTTKNLPNTPPVGQSSASTQASLQITAPDQTDLVDPEMKNIEGGSKIQVYFSKNPDSNNDFTKVFPVQRVTDRKDVAAFAVGELIKGPVESEIAQDLFTPLKLAGVSNCGGNEFNISVVNGKATLKFCKAVVSAGVGDDARIKSTLESTIKQFSSIKQVVILNNNDTCFGDLSGLNKCKN